ncbi:MAG: DUF4240 domain-containing protein [Aliishimia sp.]
MSWIRRLFGAGSPKPVIQGVPTQPAPASDMDAFWAIIDATCDTPDQIAALDKSLRGLPEDAHLQFSADYDRVVNTAFRWDLWAATYFINGGCGDDGFVYFCDWLISQGRGVFEAALADPDSLADVLHGSIPEEVQTEFEEFRYVSNDVFEEKFGKSVPRFDFPYPADPIGTPFEDDDELLAQQFPKIATWLTRGSD